MLVLTRRSGEAVILGDGTTVRIGEVRSGRVRLMITAPADVPIRREELVTPRDPQRPVRVGCS